MRFGIIGGSGLLESSLFDGFDDREVHDGNPNLARAAAQRHGADPSGDYRPPHAINYRAIAFAFQQERCDLVVGVCSVGAIKPSVSVGALLVPDDFWCPFAIQNLYEDKRGHFMPQFSSVVRQLLLDGLRDAGQHPQDGGIYANTRGPRFETKAEIRMLSVIGADVVGMTGAHEATLLGEAGLPYAMFAMVDNMANGVASSLTVESFLVAQKENRGIVERCVRAVVDFAAEHASELKAALEPEGRPASALAPPLLRIGNESADTILHARYVMTVDSEDSLKENHAVVIEGGRIKAVVPSDEARSVYRADRVLELPHHVLMPGLVNAHTHAAMNNMRGVADDLSLIDWLTQHVWPMEGKFMSDAYIRDGSYAAVAEMLRGGVTCFNDMYFYPDAACHVVRETGIRAAVGLTVLEFPNPYTKDAEEAFDKIEAMIKTWKGRHPRLTLTLAPHAPYTVSDASFERIRVVAEKHDLKIHLHLHETAGECHDSAAGTQSMHKHLSEEKTRPFENLDRLGLIGDRLIAVHMTQLTDGEVERCASAGVHVVHCPVSNMKLASGGCRVQDLLDAGVNVALGTDGTVSNNTLDMFHEMRAATLLGKHLRREATAVTARSAIRMATINGARALGLADKVGSIEVGKQADLAAVAVDDIEAIPLFDVASHLVYALGRQNVTHAWVDGTCLMEDRVLTTIDIGRVKQATSEWGAKLLAEKRKAAAAATGGTGPSPLSEGTSPFETPIPP